MIATQLHRTSRRTAAGFTLVELLVAMAIFTMLMGSITFMFVSSLRATKQGYQNMEANELARTALSIIDRDLAGCFTSRDHGDYYTFYGSPIGMMFVGVVRTRRGDNLARVTYALHHSNDFRLNVQYGLPFEQIETDDVDADGVSIIADTYALIRYYEPNVTDLDTFDLDWDGIPLGEPSVGTLRDALDGLAGFSTSGMNLTEAEERQVNALKRETWLLMVGGGGRLDDTYMLPSIWKLWNDDRHPADYVVAHNIYSSVPPAIPFSSDPLLGDVLFGEPFFRYGQVPRDMNSPLLDEYWHSDRAVLSGASLRPRIPELVHVRFKLLFESPYPGTADFERIFEKLLDVPTAFARGGR